MCGNILIFPLVKSFGFDPLGQINLKTFTSIGWLNKRACKNKSDGKNQSHVLTQSKNPVGNNQTGQPQH